MTENHHVVEERKLVEHAKKTRVVALCALDNEADHKVKAKVHEEIRKGDEHVRAAQRTAGKTREAHLHAARHHYKEAIKQHVEHPKDKCDCR